MMAQLRKNIRIAFSRSWRNILLMLFLTIIAHLAFTDLPFRYRPNDLRHIGTYHPDEGVWLAASQDAFLKFFVEQDWQISSWTDRKFGGFGTYNPPVGKYIIGTALYLQGMSTKYPTIPGYITREDLDWRNASVRQPPPDILQAAHRAIRWLSILHLLCLFLFLQQLTKSTLFPFLTAFLLALKPLYIRTSTVVMMEISTLLFTTLILWVAFHFYNKLREQAPRNTIVAYTILLGLLCGLGLSIKLNMLIIIVLLLAWGIVHLLTLPTPPPASSLPSLLQKWEFYWQTQQKTIYHTLLALTAVILLTLLIFIALNPFLYQNTIDHIQHIYSHGAKVRAYNIPAEQHLDTLEKKLNAIQLVNFELSGFFDFWFRYGKLDKFLALCGALLLLLFLIRPHTTPLEKRNVYWLTGWILTGFTTVLYWSPFIWIRWFVPIEPAVAMLQALPLACAFYALKQTVAYIRLPR